MSRSLSSTHHTRALERYQARRFTGFAADVKPLAEAVKGSLGQTHAITLLDRQPARLACEPGCWLLAAAARELQACARESNLFAPARNKTHPIHHSPPTTVHNLPPYPRHSSGPCRVVLLLSHESNALAAASMSKAEAKSKDVQHGPIHYPLWFGGSASCFAATVTHPLDLSKSHRYCHVD